MPTTPRKSGRRYENVYVHDTGSLYHVRVPTDGTTVHVLKTNVATGGLVLVSAVTPEGASAGVERGNRVLAVDGQPIRDWYRERGWQRLRADTPLRYRIEGRSGAVREIALLPTVRRTFYEQFLVPTFAAVSLVGLAFLFVGALVWRLSPTARSRGPSCCSRAAWPRVCSARC
jgi:hypothetical protein